MPLHGPLAPMNVQLVAEPNDIVVVPPIFGAKFDETNMSRRLEADYVRDNDRWIVELHGDEYVLEMKEEKKKIIDEMTNLCRVPLKT